MGLLTTKAANKIVEVLANVQEEASTTAIAILVLDFVLFLLAVVAPINAMTTAVKGGVLVFKCSPNHMSLSITIRLAP